MKKTILLLSAIMLLFAGCKKDTIFEEGQELYAHEDGLMAPALVITNDVSNITSFTAQCSGSVTSSGDGEILAHGICWSTSHNPTIDDNKTDEGTSSGNFTSNLTNLTNLTDNKTYYVRAYVTYKIADVTLTNYGDVKSFKTEELINGHEWVDLGLPSGLKWATCNVGATSPEDYGDYFAWGETSTKSTYTYENSLTYGLSISQLQSQGYIDGSGNLTSSHDAATANWGGSWRMPTKEEQQELVNNCTWGWTTQNGVKGCKVTGPNGNCIFLPAAGYRYGSSLGSAGGGGYYWSSTPSDYDHGNNSYFLGFSVGGESVGWFDRYYGRTVRPISE